MPSALKVLVIDDESHVRKFLSMVVRDAFGPFTYLEASTREEAMERFAGGLPDLVLLDINLIGASGVEVLREIRALDEHVPVVMMTSVNVRHTVEESLAAGATNYLLKDTPPEELAAALREVIAKARRPADPSL